MSRQFRILEGDALARLREMPDAHFDACLCDPPYGLSFMGKAWDHGVPAKETWAEVLRVLKPGAHLLAFGGTRTHHRLMVAIEDAGFEIRDCLMWLYGSGFPKSLDISKSIDKAAGAERKKGDPRVYAGGHVQNHGGGKQGYHDWSGKGVHREDFPSTDAAKLWDGYGTALKPAWEPIILAMKPCTGTFAENALRHGVAGLAIDAGRIPANGDSLNGGRISTISDGWDRPWKHDAAAVEECRKRGVESVAKAEDLGRWPANVLLDEESARLLDEQAGGVSRFFYVAKADTAERTAGGERNTHPTVKPIDLCAYLAKLLLPPGGSRRLLVPFSGSGSEIIGALRAGWLEAVGIENDPGYVAASRHRITQDAPMFNSEAVA